MPKDLLPAETVTETKDVSGETFTTLVFHSGVWVEDANGVMREAGSGSITHRDPDVAAAMLLSGLKKNGYNEVTKTFSQIK